MICCKKTSSKGKFPNLLDEAGFSVSIMVISEMLGRDGGKRSDEFRQSSCCLACLFLHLYDVVNTLVNILVTTCRALIIS